MFERFDAQAHPDKAKPYNGRRLVNDQPEQTDPPRQTPTVASLLDGLRTSNQTNPAIIKILEGFSSQQTTPPPPAAESTAVTCETCGSAKCMGKIPDVSCETVDIDDGSWMSFVLNPRRHLIRV